MLIEGIEMENISKKIEECQLCGQLPKLTCDTIKIGKSRILVLGESPAKDGWIKSGRAFYNDKGKLQATGKVLNDLLKICSLTIDDINFTECCKCIISDRKTLRKCMENCKPILFDQLDAFDCDIILPMGQYPTETILGKKVERLKDIVGKEFIIKFGKTKKLVIPIYHTSPANPLCYKGNLPIFKKINKIINNL